MSHYLIIEHPTRGVLTEIEFELGKPKAHWSWSGPRNGERTEKFFDVESLVKALNRVKEWNPSVYSRVTVLRSTDWAPIHFKGEARRFLTAGTEL